MNLFEGRQDGDYIGLLNTIPVGRARAQPAAGPDAANHGSEPAVAMPPAAVVLPEVGAALYRFAPPARSPLAEAYRRLAQQVRHRLRNDRHTVLALTAPRDGSRIAELACPLALALASIDAPVLLVDANLRGEGLPARLGLAGQPGLAAALAGRGAWEEQLVDPGVPRLQILPAGHAPEDSDAALGSDTMGRLVAQWRQRFRGHCVLVALPALLDDSQALGFLSWSDSSLLVVDDAGTRLDDLSQAAELLAPFALMGSVLRPAQAAQAPVPWRGAPSRAPWWRGRLPRLSR